MRTSFGFGVILGVLICILFCGIESAENQVETLRLVQVVFRHGDRSPLHAFPNDPYNDKDIWPEGKGQLTGKGKDQHYDLGKFFRDRYDGFVERLYNRKQIHVLSSDTDRTLMSAEANLAGLFPVVKNISDDMRLNHIPKTVLKSRVHDHINIQFVPIHTLSQERDRLLKMTAPCPRRSEAKDEFYKTSEEYLGVVRKNEEFLKFLAEKSGFSYVGLDDVVLIHDPLFCQQQHNLPLPDWATQEVMEKMAELRGIDFAFASPTEEVRRLYGGPLLKRLLANMLEVKSGHVKNPRKMFMHSAHDDTLAAVMSSFGVFDPQIPPFASAFIIELHLNESLNQFWVQMFFKNSTDKTPHELRVPGCGSPCYLTDLTVTLQPVIPMRWEEECRTSRKVAMGPISIIYKPGYPMFLIFLIVFIATSIFWIAILCYISKKTKRGIFSTKIMDWQKREYTPLL